MTELCKTKPISRGSNRWELLYGKRLMSGILDFVVVQNKANWCRSDCLVAVLLATTETGKGLTSWPVIAGVEDQSCKTKPISGGLEWGLSAVQRRGYNENRG